MMNNLVMTRLIASGWSKERNVDYSSIEGAYRENGIKMPDAIKDFFQSFAYLEVKVSCLDGDIECHCFNPIHSFAWDKKEYLEHIFDDYGIFGMAYPLGDACDYNMILYMHENGHFYLFMDGGPLIDIGDSVDNMLNNLIGNSADDWAYLNPIS